ncbi:penicillin-binding protein 2 [Candidatus Falkowbacteria bacterium]|mgnify:CR=1 FL=1|jgi:penicillin-binding protein 2|nr:penicillin-binding protein 2 [Candidatus Falkowbacteria bacterium]MBT4433115.1 penicillin-binding protein 2 [Candidatus Falkowbacteria bacterium]
MDDQIFPKFNTIKKGGKGSPIIDEFSFNMGKGGKHRERDTDGNFMGSSFKKDNLTLFLASVFFLLGILFIRLGYLQVIKGDHYFKIAEGNRIKTKIIKAKRGVIYDKNKKQLVYNRPNFILSIVPEELKRTNELVEKFLWEFLEENLNEHIDKEQLKKLLIDINLNSEEKIIVQEKIPYEEALALMDDIKFIPGLYLDNGNLREYDNLSSISHWIGYTGKINEEEFKEKKDQGYLLNDYLGKIGLEKYYEDTLKGKDGERKIEVNALGEETGTISKINPENGNNLLLSIDYDLQVKSEEVLKNKLKEINKNSGVVIALDPRNGEILSMVSLPTFSANDFAYKINPGIYASLLNDPNKPLFNRAIMGEYPSGSIIKPIVGASALEEEVISPWTTFLSTGGISIGQWFFPDWQTGGHGRVNLRRAIANSVNTFFYITVGGYDNFKGLGMEKLKEYGEKFGLNNKTGIDLPGEQTGFLPTKQWKKEVKNESWYIGDTYHLSIGQGDLLVTPLQAAIFTSIIANQGTFYEPHLVKKILNENQETEKNIEAKIIRKDFISKENIGTVSRGMRDCVTYGSCVALNNLPAKVAGKTGTAQHSSNKDPHAWFTAFAPFDNPEIVLVVLIEEGEGGSKTAAPVAKEILNWYFSN